MVKMTKEEAAKAISEKTDVAMNLVREAESIADEYGLEFSFDVAYGMGGWYTGKRNTTDVDSDDDYDEWNESGGWTSSSQGC